MLSLGWGRGSGPPGIDHSEGKYRNGNATRTRGSSPVSPFAAEQTDLSGRRRALRPFRRFRHGAAGGPAGGSAGRNGGKKTGLAPKVIPASRCAPPRWGPRGAAPRDMPPGLKKNRSPGLSVGAAQSSSPTHPRHYRQGPRPVRMVRRPSGGLPSPRSPPAAPGAKKVLKFVEFPLHGNHMRSICNLLRNGRYGQPAVPAPGCCLFCH